MTAGIRVSELAGDAAGNPGGLLAEGDLRSAPAACSPRSENAAVYDAANRAVRVISHGSGGVSVSTLNTTMLAGPFRLLAVSGRQDAVIAGVVDDGGGSTIALRAAGVYRSLTGFEEVAALAFGGGAANRAVADAGAGQVLMTRQGLSGGEPSPLRAPGPDFGAPRALAWSADGKILAVLGKGSTVALPGPTGGPPLPIDCRCTAAVLEFLRGNAVFRLTGSATPPVWLVKVLGGDPKLRFIPALPLPGPVIR